MLTIFQFFLFLLLVDVTCLTPNGGNTIAREDGAGDPIQDLQLQLMSVGGTVGISFSSLWSKASTLGLGRGRPSSGVAGAKLFRSCSQHLWGLKSTAAAEPEKGQVLQA